jgi:hypothetical protein
MILDRRHFLEGLPALLPAGLAASAEEGRKTHFGVNPILYSSTVFGANRPNPTYVIPFDTLAAREIGADRSPASCRFQSTARWRIRPSARGPRALS